MWIVIIAVIVLAGAGTFFLIRHNSKQSVNDAFNEMFEVEAQMRIRNQDDQAKKTLTDFLAEHPELSKEQQSKIYAELATISNTAGNTEEAVSWQTKSLDNTSNASFISYYNLAESCFSSNDKDCAIKNYKLAQERLKTDNNRPMDWQTYEAHIKNQLKALGA